MYSCFDQTVGITFSPYLKPIPQKVIFLLHYFLLWHNGNSIKVIKQGVLLFPFKWYPRKNAKRCALKIVSAPKPSVWGNYPARNEYRN